MITIEFREKAVGHLKDRTATHKKPVQAIDEMKAFVDDYKKIKRISRYTPRG